MPRPLDHLEISDAERRLLHGIFASEVEGLMDGNAIDFAAAGVAEIPRGAPIQNVYSEYRIRFEFLADLVAALDMLGWHKDTGSLRVYFYPPVVRALRYCKGTVDAENERGFREGDGSADVVNDEKVLVDRLLGAIDG